MNASESETNQQWKTQAYKAFKKYFHPNTENTFNNNQTLSLFHSYHILVAYKITAMALMRQQFSRCILQSASLVKGTPPVTSD